MKTKAPGLPWNETGGCSRARQLAYMHMQRRESGTKIGQQAVGSKPRLQTCIYYTSARASSRRRGAKRYTIRAGDAPLPMHFSIKTTTSTRPSSQYHVYVKRDLFSASNYERSPHLTINTILCS